MSRKRECCGAPLDKNGLAPETFGKISAKAWDYFSRTILADKAHEFLLLCVDGEWKLREGRQSPTPLVSQDEDHDRDDPDAEKHHSEDSNDDPVNMPRTTTILIQTLRMTIPMQENQSSTPRMATRPPALRQMAPPRGDAEYPRAADGSIHRHTHFNNIGPSLIRLLPPPSASATHGTTTSNGTDPGCVGHNTGPPPDTPPNSHVPAKIGKKRKPASEGSNTSSTTNKRQKVSNALAIPTEGNTIKNICIGHWNKEQPGGQGPLSEFDVYFKSLTDADKEVRSLRQSSQRDIAPDAPQAFQEGTAQRSGHGGRFPSHQVHWHSRPHRGRPKRGPLAMTRPAQTK
ncbi:hypothetical protein EDB92DRAFT_2118026 [Lactarius akahatsu]|uniref:Uncharacterized protein n=1 Tax=Lactarius akahatsu TaxID=416441 RepID=A0AAD4L7V6_9AGAM|nr:hypothetical protein EDB92DRAFT_2118026 [Lactarius akahatsu]